MYELKLERRHLPSSLLRPSVRLSVYLPSQVDLQPTLLELLKIMNPIQEVFFKKLTQFYLFFFISGVPQRLDAGD